MEEIKKKNTKRKGERKENKCVHELVRNGFSVFFKSCTVKRGPFFIGLDFADLFDVVAARPAARQPYNQWLFISVKNKKADSSFGDHRDKIREWASKYLPIEASVQLWCGITIKENGHDRSAWRIWNIGKSKEDDNSYVVKEKEVSI